MTLSMQQCLATAMVIKIIKIIIIIIAATTPAAAVAPGSFDRASKQRHRSTCAYQDAAHEQKAYHQTATDFPAAILVLITESRRCCPGLAISPSSIFDG